MMRAHNQSTTGMHVQPGLTRLCCAEPTFKITTTIAKVLGKVKKENSY